MRKLYKSFDNTVTSRYSFKSAGVSISESAESLDFLKKTLFDASQSIQPSIYDAMKRVGRDAQKALTPKSTKAWYTYSEGFTEKGTPTGPHLEHVIPFSEGLNKFLSNDITAKEFLLHPTALIHNVDKYKFKGTLETVATWEYPFHRYKQANIIKEIISCRGDVINLSNWTIDDHFDLVGFDG